MRSTLPLAALLGLLAVGCPAIRAPRSPIPDAQSAIARLDATYASVSGVNGSAKIDYLGKKGRVRGDVSVLASGPASLRFAITADVIGVAGEVASDGERFWADDKAHGRFIVGDAKPCNIAMITQVPLPSKELVPMLWGMRPALDGPIVCDGISWSADGHYVVMLKGKQGLAHELHVVPTPSDFDKPWAEQRLRLLSVVGFQGESLVYRVRMKDHAPASTAKPLVDPYGLSPTVPASGPDVTVDVPRMIHVEVPDKGSDVIFKYSELTLNPPLIPNAFRLVIKPGVPVSEAVCD